MGVGDTLYGVLCVSGRGGHTVWSTVLVYKLLENQLRLNSSYGD